MSTPPARTPPPTGSRPAPKRWGVRTLAYLALAFLAMFISMIQHQYTVLTFGMLIVAFVGAAYSSLRGLMSMRSE
jgi:hypothetical protein